MPWMTVLLLLPMAIVAQPAGKQFAIVTTAADASTALAICNDNGREIF